ncbi:MAG TPA: hypothetical protein VHE54_18935 [Puia sp.]|nr:hypothetical protein [Puia sp.]
MIPFHELRVGDIVLVEFSGQRTEGEVIDKAEADRLVCVDNDVQSFWYGPDELYAIPLDENQLMKFGFEKQEQPDGSVKYLKGPFRILLPLKDSFAHFEMWYREDRRHITQHISVHQLQNHYHQMTKVDLVRGVQTH